MMDLDSTMPRWRRIALPVSLILNVFFIALIGAHLWRIREGEAAYGAPLARALRNAEAVLAPEDAAAFSAVIQHEAPQYIEAAQQLRAARQALRRQITAERFNPETAQQAFAGWQVAWSRFMGDVRGPLVDALAKVSPEGRRKLIAERRKVEILRFSH